MTCSRLSRGALALTLAASLAGLVLAYGAVSAAFERAAAARQALHTTVSAGLAREHQAPGNGGQSS